MTDPMDNLRQASADVSGVEVLSPAAQEVLDAVVPYPIHEQAIAAALRAAAARSEAVEIRTAPGMFEFEEVIRPSDLLAIAAELDTTHSN